MAFLLRVGSALTLQHLLDNTWERMFLIEGDANGYWELGQKLNNGETYCIYDPPRYVLRMPGFPLFLATCFRLFGEKPLAVRLTQALVGTVACALVFVLGTLLHDRTTGNMAAALVAFSPMLIGFTPVLLTETLFATCLTAALVALSWLVLQTASDVSHHRFRYFATAFLSGVLCAVACYVRPSWYLVAPCFCILYILLGSDSKLPSDQSEALETPTSKKRMPVSASQRGIAAFFLMSGLLLTLLPWAWRNYQRTGAWIFTTLWVGASLYDGCNPLATGESDMTFFDQENLLGSMSEIEVDHHYRQKAWSFMKENPARAMQLSLIKTIRFWSAVPNSSQFGNWWQKVIVAGYFLPFLFLAMRGTWLMRNHIWIVILGFGPILYFTAIHSQFIGSIRYRLPAEYPFSILAAIGLRDVWKHLRFSRS